VKDWHYFGHPRRVLINKALPALFRDGVDPVLMELGFAQLEHDDL
jgi:hypothetical protein